MTSVLALESASHHRLAVGDARVSVRAGRRKVGSDAWSCVARLAATLPETSCNVSVAVLFPESRERPCEAVLHQEGVRLSSFAEDGASITVVVATMLRTSENPSLAWLRCHYIR